VSTERVHVFYVQVGEPDIDAATECGECGFDSVLAFPLRLLSADGVGDFGVYKVCGRCSDGVDE
jgi:ArsR family metal-binding transcriptional regulator